MYVNTKFVYSHYPVRECAAGLCIWSHQFVYMCIKELTTQKGLQKLYYGKPRLVYMQLQLASYAMLLPQ